ncbi:hypothetical protein B0H12DRAFT_1142271 [Mycena haematopus]|nr:hypothetical protein B0H12DRAFT_1142271 [Mycena haematopus]
MIRRSSSNQLLGDIEGLEFRRSRVLEKEAGRGPALGPHAPLLSFFGGPGVCGGWRFAYISVESITWEKISFLLCWKNSGTSSLRCGARTEVNVHPDRHRKRFSSTSRCTGFGAPCCWANGWASVTC